MTEFHQLKESQDHTLEPITDFQEPVIDTIAQDAPSPAESPIEATAEMNAFRYYYASAGQSPQVTLPVAKRLTKRILSPRYLAGSGVIGATLISGVVMAVSPNHSKPQPLQGGTQSEINQIPKLNPTQPQIASPEVIPLSRSTSAKSLQNSKKAVSLNSSGVALEQYSAQPSQQAMVQQTIPVPAPPPAFDLPTVAVTVPQSLPKPLPAPPVRPPAQATPLQKSPAANPSLQTSPSPASPTEVSFTPFPPQTSPPPSPTGVSFTPFPPQTSPPPASRPDGSLTPTPAIAPTLKPDVPQSAADARCVSPIAENASATDPRSLPVQPSLSVPTSETVVTATNSKAQLEKSALVKVAQTIAAQAPSPSDAEKELQTLLELPKRFPTSAGIAVLPLPCQAAQTAIAKQRVGEFAVLQLSPQDYQKRWKTSSNNPQTMIPTYGFVDYKQQAIVLVQESRS